MTAATNSRERTSLPLAAQLYLLLVYGASVFAVMLAMAGSAPIDQTDWRLAVLLGVGAAVSQLFVVLTPNNQSYHTSPVLIVAAALLLPPPLIAFVAVVQHVPEWLRERYPWYIQTFNIANYTLSGLAAHRVFIAISGADGLIGDADQRYLAAGLGAAAFFVFVNHLLLAVVLRFARGHSIRQSGLFSLQSLSTDFTLALLGVVVAAVWHENPWLVALALAPLVLVHRTLALPKLEAEARQDPKTELFNARHFSKLLKGALERSDREDRPVSVLIADLDLLREINNRYGHLAGDVVLAGVADIFRAVLRTEDIASRFGGEEFALLLPNTGEEEAAATAERIRAAVGDARFEVETSDEPIAATVSIGVATYPVHASSASELIYRADVAAYRAKAQGRNRIAMASDAAVFEELTAALPGQRRPGAAAAMLDRVSPPPLAKTQPPAPNYLSLSGRLRLVVGIVGAAGIAAGVAALLSGGDAGLLGLGVLIALVAAGQALAVKVLDRGTISLSAVGALAGAAMFGPRVALPIAITVCAVDWSANRGKLHKEVFNAGTIVLSTISGAVIYAFLPGEHWAFVAGGALAGAAYYAVNIGLLTTVIAFETTEPWWETCRLRFSWLFPHYLVYGVVGGMVAVAYDVAGIIALFVFAVPLILVRKAQLDYIDHTEENVRRLRQAAETIEQQNESLTRANQQLRDRATEAMESLAAAVDARDTYTAGHSRRVQQIAVSIGRGLTLDASELESLSFAALFHDIGKLAVPDDVLLKAGPLDARDWWVVRRHSEAGERIIGHLGFLADATPAIRHHHEHFDGSGYPDGLGGQEIPVGARILHVADAFDSMTTNRVYRPALSLDEALAELRRGRGTQFCPECVAVLENLIALGTLAHLLDLDSSPAAA